MTLTGAHPRLTVYEKVAGQPSYTAQYNVDTPGGYLTRVSQLLSGGLSAQYFDNQFLWGTPVLERVDPQVSDVWIDMTHHLLLHIFIHRYQMFTTMHTRNQPNQ